MRRKQRQGELGRVGAIEANRKEIARADADEAPLRLAFETGPEGDGQRRYILSNGRVVNRTISEFLKIRKMSEAGSFDVDSSVVRCPSIVGSGSWPAIIRGRSD